jgi:hypothetical protein
MGNVTLPTPVALAGGALCVLGGYLVGAATGPDTTTRSTAQVVSYDADTEELCLGGDAVGDLAAAEDGVLCGLWRRTAAADRPAEGDDFRFVTMSTEEGPDAAAVTYIYGDVVR